MQMQTAAIIGFGRFGELMASLCAQRFEVVIVENDNAKRRVAEQVGYKIISIEDIVDADFIFLAIPISGLEDALNQLAPLLRRDQVVVDLCSVKVYPMQLMQKILKVPQIMGCHAMFGPDSAKKGLQGRQVALCPLRIEEDNLNAVRDLWERQGCKVVETTSEKHDHDMVYTLAFTHTIARIILHMKLPEVTFRTRGFEDITEVARLSAKDSEQLYYDMLYYNPYFKDLLQDFRSSVSKTIDKLQEIDADQRKNGIF